MAQQLVILILFLGAIIYLGWIVYRGFRAGSGCSTGCGACSIDTEKIEKRFREKHVA